MCIEKGKGAIGDENTDGHWQHCLLSALRETATGTHRELHQASTRDDHRDEGKNTLEEWSMDGWDMRQFFFSQDLAGDGNGTVLSVLFLTAPLAALLAAEPRSAMAH